jgi:transposase-like protein
MSDDVSVRKKYSPEDRARILADYHASGLTQREFVAKAGISLTCLNVWSRRARLAGSGPASVSFAPVKLKRATTTLPPSASGPKGGIEVELPGKLLVRLPDSYSQADAVRFILQLGAAC